MQSLPIEPKKEICDWCKDPLPVDGMPFFVRFTSKRDGHTQVTRRFDKLRCMVQWAILEGWPK